MKKIILITAGILFMGSLFAQSEKTMLYVKQMVASAEITGETKIALNTAATVVLTEDSCKNIVCFNDDADAIDYTLPAAKQGLVRGYGDAAGGAITVDPYDGVDYIMLNGVSVGAGDEIVSDGVAGRYIVLIALDDTRWFALPSIGWVDANP